MSIKAELTFLQKQELKRLQAKAIDLQKEINSFKRAGDFERANELEEEYEALIKDINSMSEKP